MTLLPDVPFTTGDVWSPDLAYLAFHQVFDDQPTYLGHHNRITDAELSNASGQLKDKMAVIRDPLVVTVVSGLNLNHAAGVIGSSQGTTVTLPSTNFTVPDNSTTFVYYTLDGTLTQNTSLPAVSRALAKVVTSGGAVTTLTDLRGLERRAVTTDPGYTMVFGGQSTVDKVCTAGETFNQGLYYYRDFTVPSGVTINITGYANIKCSGKIRVDGTINVSTLAQGADAVNLPSINGYLAFRAGIGLGSNGTTIVPWAVQPYGSAGQSGAVSGSNVTGNFTSGGGGNGGGGLRLEAARGIDIYGTILAKGGNAVANTVVSGAAILTGGGGGSGGTVVLASPAYVTVQPGATVDVRGGNGGNAVAGSGAVLQGSGGGGGAAGVIVLFAPSGQANTTGSTLLLTGGSGGTALGAVSGVSGAKGASSMSLGGLENATTSSSNVGGTGTLIVLPYAPLG